MKKIENMSFWDNFGGPHRFMHGLIPAYKLFLQQNQEIPVVLCWTSDHELYFHYNTVLDILKKLGYTGTDDLICRNLNATQKKEYVSEHFMNFEEGLSIYMTGGYYREELESPHNILPDAENSYHSVDEIFVFHTGKNAERALNVQMALLEAQLTVKITSTLNMVFRDAHDYYLYPFEIKKPHLNLEMNYGHDFLPIHEKIMGALSLKDKQGVVLLHGIPGSGKTHYIRYLINSLKEKELIYVPPDMAHHLSAPDFLPFLMKHSNSVLIIEDAENIIRDRQYQENQAVANLLNLSDGLLGDCLNLQIIATFNSDITRIDSALLRKGRLIAQWKFDKLSAEDAQKLSNSLGFSTSIDTPLTLAEIYGQNDTQGLTPANTNGNNKIGF